MGAIPTSRQVHTRLLIGRTDGVTWTDVTGFLRRADVELGDVSAAGTGSTGGDVSVRRLSFALRSDTASGSFSPKNTGSPWNRLGGSHSPLLWPMREVLLDVATAAPGATPQSDDWTRLFHGYLGDGIQVESGSVTCECRDLGKRLQDRYIETVRTYGSSDGTAAETVIQAVIDDNLGAGQVTLYCPASPGLAVTPYQVQYQTVWDAIQQVAAQIGWWLGYRWDSDTSAFRLTLMAPPRSKSEPDWNLTALDDIYTQELGVSDADIRNVVQVAYRSAATGQRATVQATDTVSVAEYGRRAMSIAEEDTSLIDTEAEATALANAALADLKDMSGRMQVSLPLLPRLELFDAMTLTNLRVSSGQEFCAVESIRHTLDYDGGRMRTEVVASNRVVGAHTRWLAMQTRPGVGDLPAPPDTEPPATPTVTAKPISGGMAVTTSTPTESDWAYDELYVHPDFAVADDWTIDTAPNKDCVTACLDMNDKRSGVASARFDLLAEPTFGASVVLTSPKYPYTPGDAWSVTGHSKGNNVQCHVMMEWGWDDRAIRGVQPPQLQWTPGAPWSQFQVASALPQSAWADAAWVRLKLGAVAPVNSAGTVRFDDIAFRKVGGPNVLANGGFELAGGHPPGPRLVASGKSTYFEVTEGINALQDVTVFARRVDTSGNVSGYSDPVTVTSRAVSTHGIAPGAVSQTARYMETSVEAWTSSTTQADLPGMAVVFEVDGDTTETVITAVLAAVVGATTTAASYMARGRWRLVIDGTTVYTQTMRGGAVSSAEARAPGSLYACEGTVTLLWAGQLAPGIHDAKIAWVAERVGTGGGGVIHIGVANRILLAQQFKR